MAMAFKGWNRVFASCNPLIEKFVWTLHGKMMGWCAPWGTSEVSFIWISHVSFVLKSQNRGRVNKNSKEIGWEMTDWLHDEFKDMLACKLCLWIMLILRASFPLIRSTFCRYYLLSNLLNPHNYKIKSIGKKYKRPPQYMMVSLDAKPAGGAPLLVGKGCRRANNVS